MKLCLPPHLSSASALPCVLRNRKPRRQHTGALCVQHSPTAAELLTSFLLNYAPNSLELNALITRFRESYSSVRMSCESKRVKKSSSDWLNSGNALIHHLTKKCDFRVSVLPGSAEALDRSGGKTKHQLISCFLSNTYAKKLS